jgi:hypothetical protein
VVTRKIILERAPGRKRRMRLVQDMTMIFLTVVQFQQATHP